MRNGAYQLFMWGWVADYPDPENFLFLLWSEMTRSKSGGPNTANFSNARFDELYLAMKSRENGPQRLAEIQEMLAILERERPWIELFHREEYMLYHAWLSALKPTGMSYPTLKYHDLDPDAARSPARGVERARAWPAYAMLAITVGVLLPGIVTFLRERQ